MNTEKKNTSGIKLKKVYGAALYGINAVTITIEVSISPGIKYILVGLPDNVVKESLHRIESAIKISGYRMPRQQIVVNLSPADIKKEGSAFDLSIAMGILAASNQMLSENIKKYFIMGELSLDGKVLPIKGALSIALRAKAAGYQGFILPKINAQEAAVVKSLKIYGIEHIAEVIQFFNGKKSIDVTTFSPLKKKILRHNLDDFSDVKGQYNIKRAMEIAAAGKHHLILIGPPGSGKTMLAKRFANILPPLSLEESLETTKIYSVCGTLPADQHLIVQRPFTAPHHTISDVALVGGGGVPKPGQISLAHNGVLFLDELPEFKRSVLEVLRQPLEEGLIHISRAKSSVTYPCKFLLIAAMNPCPCGNFNHPNKMCNCAIGAVKKYLSKISGPLMDRIDLHIEVAPVDFKSLTSQAANSEKSETIRQRVERVYQIQYERFKHQDIYCNGEMNTKMIEAFCPIDSKCESLLKIAVEKLKLSARAYSRIIKVARTIADLDQADRILENHLAEAIHYRSLDREKWNI